MKVLPSVAGNDVPRDLAEVYERYTPLLMSAVDALKRKGMAVRPEDALDLVHDFYVIALAGVFGRYDACRGQFSTYLFGSFLRFARRRIGREARRNQFLCPLDEEIKQAAVAPPPPETSEEEEEAIERRRAEALKRLAVGVKDLPREFQTILEARLVKRETEREIAQRFGLTRHATRQRLGEALGRAAVAMGHDEAIPADLRLFAVRLWRDEIPLMKVAKELRLSRREALRCQRKLVRTLISAAAALENVPYVRERSERNDRTVPGVGGSGR